MEWLSAIAVGDVGLASIVVIVVLAILSGRLVPRSVMDAAVAAAETREQGWREAHGASEQARGVLLSQNSTLIYGGETTRKLVEELHSGLGMEGSR